MSSYRLLPQRLKPAKTNNFDQIRFSPRPWRHPESGGLSFPAGAQLLYHYPSFWPTFDAIVSTTAQNTFNIDAAELRLRLRSINILFWATKMCKDHIVYKQQI